MKAFLKRYGMSVVFIFLALGILFLGYNEIKGMLSKIGDDERAEMQAKVDAADAKAAAAIEAKRLLAEQNGKDREDARIRHEDEMRKMKHTFEVYKSRTAEDLRDKDATIEEVLAEKEKDEIVIEAAKKTIAFQSELFYGVMLMWKISDENMAAEDQRERDAMAEKFNACQAWSKRLEDKLRPSFWKTVKTAGKYALAFGAGYAAGRVK